jgi:hypothetical protein
LSGVITDLKHQAVLGLTVIKLIAVEGYSGWCRDGDVDQALPPIDMRALAILTFDGSDGERPEDRARRLLGWHRVSGGDEFVRDVWQLALVGDGVAVDRGLSLIVNGHREGD